MKFYSTILIFFIYLYSSGQSLQDSITIRTNEILQKNNGNTFTVIEKKELVTNAYFFQNQAFELDEIKYDYENALMYTDKALGIWISLKDSVNEANLRKYKGFLLGHLNRYDEGKKEIYRAITLFNTKGKAYGVAVSQFDLSRVYEFESILDSAIYFANIALNYWKIQADTDRIMIVNNQLINLFLQSKDIEQAKKVQAKTVKLLNKENIHWQPLIDYYFLSAKLFENLKPTETSFKYKKLYADKINELKQRNIITKSKYALQN